MNSTLSLAILWTVGVGTVLLVASGFVYWLFFDTDSGERPDWDRVRRSREYLADNWSLEDYFDHERVCDEEGSKGTMETRWTQLKAWWRGK